MLKATHAQEDRESARRKAEVVAGKLRALRLDWVARIDAEGCEETFTSYDFPSAHGRYLRTNNPLERLNREISCNEGSRQFPGRSCRAHAGERPAAVHGWPEMGHTALPEHVYRAEAPSWALHLDTSNVSLARPAPGKSDLTCEAV